MNCVDGFRQISQDTLTKLITQSSSLKLSSWSVYFLEYLYSFTILRFFSGPAWCDIRVSQAVQTSCSALFWGTLRHSQARWDILYNPCSVLWVCPRVSSQVVSSRTLLRDAVILIRPMSGIHSPSHSGNHSGEFNSLHPYLNVLDPIECAAGTSNKQWSGF